jgi:hypothetical protein
MGDPFWLPTFFNLPYKVGDLIDSIAFDPPGPSIENAGGTGGSQVIIFRLEPFNSNFSM